MTLRQTIQAAPVKANELIAKLSDTSNQAVKTRETLFDELNDELSCYVEIEELHLLPVLRKHAATKDLVAGAAKANQDLRALLTELGAAPKDNDAFLERVNELKKGFQAHVRGERNGLLPAVLAALSDEEAAGLAGDIENAVSDAEKAKRDAKREEAGRLKREAEAAEQAQAAGRAAVRAGKATERAAQDAAKVLGDKLQQGAEAVKGSASRITAALAEQTEQSKESFREALSAYRGTSEHAVRDLRAVSASSSAAVKVAAEVGSAWLGFAMKVVGLNREASRRILQCRTVGQLAEVQKDYLNCSMRTVMEGGTEILQIAQRASKQALNPLQDRLDEAA